MSAEDVLVRFDAVSKAFAGGDAVVRALSLEVRRGEFLTLLGPSGSGKTTSLMMLAGFETPDLGRIELDGRDLAGVPPHRRGIGVVFQNFALFPHMNVAANIAFPLSVRRLPRVEVAERVARALALVHLDGMGGRDVASLSGGQQQRVALARALVFAPKLVLLDEPLGALDRALREEMQLELRRLHRELGVTIVYVTHDQDEALTVSDRVAVIAGGVVRQLDTPASLYDRPADVFVAGFVGENNLLPGRVVAVEDDVASVFLDGGPAVHADACGLAPGEPCVVAIRPERVAVVAAEASSLGPDALPCLVEEAIHKGDHLRLVLRFEGGARLTVKRPAAASLFGLASGEAVAVAWQPERALLFRPGLSPCDGAQDRSPGA